MEKFGPQNQSATSQKEPVLQRDYPVERNARNTRGGSLFIILADIRQRDTTTAGWKILENTNMEIASDLVPPLCKKLFSA